MCDFNRVERTSISKLKKVKHLAMKIFDTENTPICFDEKKVNGMFNFKDQNHLEKKKTSKVGFLQETCFRHFISDSEISSEKIIFAFENLKKIHSKIFQRNFKILKCFKNRKIECIPKDAKQYKLKLTSDLKLGIGSLKENFESIATKTTNLTKNLSIRKKNFLFASITGPNFKCLPKSLNLFLGRFYQQIQNEFPENLEIYFKEKPRKEKLKIIPKKIFNNENFQIKNWIKKITKEEEMQFIYSMNFERNYSLILANVFAIDESSKIFWINNILKIFSAEIRKWILTKFYSNNHGQKDLFEIISKLFIFHLDIPQTLLAAINMQSRLSLIIFTLSLICNMKQIFGFLNGKSINLGDDNFLFDVHLATPMSEKEQKNAYFCCWYLHKILKNFQTLVKSFSSNDSTKMKNEMLKSLFSVQYSRANDFEFTETLSSILLGIRINQVQQFFIFIKTQFHFQSNMCPLFVNQKKKRVFFYKDQKTQKLSSSQINLHFLDENPLQDRVNYKSKIPLIKTKKSKEQSLFVGFRLKKILKIYKNQVESGPNIDSFEFRISNKHINKIYVKYNLEKTALNKIHKNFHNFIQSKFLTCGKLSVNTLQMILCTEKFKNIIESFFKFEMIQNEFLYSLKKPALLDKCVLPQFILKKLSNPNSKNKSIWSVMDYLNVCAFLESIDKNFDYTQFID